MKQKQNLQSEIAEIAGHQWLMPENPVPWEAEIRGYSSRLTWANSS
jgi:hypothetical protein